MADELRVHDDLGEVAMLRTTARLRARVVAILHAAQERSGLTQVDIAAKLGVRKSAVNQVFRGAGNIQIDTLGEYLAAMGLEADVVVAKLGEFRQARSERRAPYTIKLTIADHDRVVDSHIVIVHSSHNAAGKGVDGGLAGRGSAVLAGGSRGAVKEWR